MNGRYHSWFAAFTTLLVSTVLACSAFIAIPEVFGTLTPNPPQLPTAAAESSQEPTPRPTSSINCSNGDCAKACVSKLGAIPQTSGSSEAQPKAAGQGSKSTPAKVLVTYPLNGDELGSPQYSDTVSSELSSLQTDNEGQQRIWGFFSAIIPAHERAELAYYIISTDGKGGMLASVEHFSGPSDTWALVVDSADVNKPRDLTFTLLHEFGHLLTLNSSQVTPDQAVLQHPDDLDIYAREAAGCSQYFATGGCSRPDSYINQFFDRFWTKIYGEWSTVNAARNDGNYSSLLVHFYRKHPTQFVTPYASTSPEEDIAESWSYFVLNPKPPDDSIAHRKVLFFYDFPELVALRDEIISGICSYASSQ